MNLVSPKDNLAGPSGRALCVHGQARPSRLLRGVCVCVCVCVCVKVREGRLSLGQGTLHGGLMDLILFTCL